MHVLLSILTLFGQAIFDGPRSTGTSIQFQIRTDTNSFYVLEQSDQLTTGWREELLLPGTGESIGVTNELSGATRFFRARILPRTFVSKPGVPVNIPLATPQSTATWIVEGELPSGMNFTNGTFSGTPSADAAEKSSTGDYTNTVRLAGAPGSEVQLVHHIKFSFSQNIFPDRPSGPSLNICLHCHGSGFPPDFRSTPLTLINAQAGSGGSCPDTWSYIVPGDLSRSLIYQKVTAPPCGDRMPQGGPFLDQEQVDRLARWIRELTPEDQD